MALLKSLWELLNIPLFQVLITFKALEIISKKIR